MRTIFFEAKIIPLAAAVFGATVCLCAVAQDKSPSPPKGQAANSAPEQRSTFGEDFTNLSLQGSSLKLRMPQLAETDQIPNTGFIRERFNVDWRRPDPFDLYVIRPKGVAKPPVILYLYSYLEDTEKFKTNAWCESAVEGGYAAVGFVAAVTGHRTRYRLPKEWFASNMEESLGATVHDVQLILDYLATRNDLDLTRVGMFGTGSGASIAILASAADSRIRVLDLLGPWGDWPRWVAGTKVLRDDERANYAKPEFLNKVAPLEPVSWLPKVKATALRIQDVRSNKGMPDDAQLDLEAAAPDFAIINQFGNGQAFLQADSPGNLFQWMKSQLKTGEPTQVASAKIERIHFYPAIEPFAPAWIKAGPSEDQKATADSKQKDSKDKDSKNKDKPSDQQR